MAIIRQCVLLAFVLNVVTVQKVLSQSFNPSILQDTRDLPHTDGTFGFLYRTEDGIAHAAKGDSNGRVHGRFSYTDPTGLKVNYNYNAGSQAVPGYNYDDNTPSPVPAPRPSSQASNNYPRQEEYNSQYREEPPVFRPRPNYARPNTGYRASPIYDFEDSQQQQRPASRPAYRDPGDIYQESRSRNSGTRRNEVYDY